MSAVVKSLVSKPLSLFVTTTCPFCMGARKMASEKGINASVLELDQEADGKAIRSELTELTGQRTVPYVFSNGKFLGGFSDLSKQQPEFWDAVLKLQKGN